MINDIWGLQYDPAMAKVIADADAACCLMHNRKNTDYHDFMKDVLMDLENSLELAKNAGISYDKIMIAEEGVLNGGFGMMVNEFLSEHDYKGEVRCLGIDDQFVEHGSVSELRRMLKIDGESIADSIRQWMKE